MAGGKRRMYTEKCRTEKGRKCSPLLRSPSSVPFWRSPQNGISSSVSGSDASGPGAWLPMSPPRSADAPRPPPPPPQQHDAVAFDLGRVPLVAVLIVPLARLELALDVDLLALGEVFRQRFSGLAPQHHAMPFGLLLTLSGLVVPDLRGRHVERGDRGAARRVAQFRIAPEISDENDFVHAAHRCPFGGRRPSVASGVGRTSAGRRDATDWRDDAFYIGCVRASQSRAPVWPGWRRRCPDRS